MGLFGWFGRKKNKQEPDVNSEQYMYKGMTLEEALTFTNSDDVITDEGVASMTRSLCDQINFYRSQQAETKKEYDIVSEYLADIQRIESMGEKDRCNVLDSARTMVNLDEERFNFQNSSRKIPLEQHRCLTMYEDDIPDRLREMERNEEYLGLVKEDMSRIDSERESIESEKDAAVSKQRFLHKMAYTVMALAITIFIVLLMLMNSFGKEFMLSFFVTGAATLAFIAYYVVESAKLKQTVKLCDRKLNRATQLMNKVKLKYVNTTSALDYAREKYHVADHNEFKGIWTEYVREKDEEKRYRRNTELLNSYQEDLTTQLSSVGVVRPDAWIHSPQALIDKGEMLDFKDGISKRRRKLRAQLEFNHRQQDNIMNDIDTLRKKYPDHASVIDRIVAEALE